MATPDLSAIPVDDLHAMAAGDMSKVSEPTLHFLAGAPQTVPTMQPNTGLAGPLGHVIDAGLGPADTLASAASHAASGVLDPMIGLGARIHALFTGKDPNAAADAAHQWLAQRGTYHAVTPTGKTVGDAANATLGAATEPFNAAGNALDAATGRNPDLEHLAGGASDIAGTAATLIPGAGELMDAARGAANPARVAKTGTEVAEAAGYKNLQSQQDFKLPGPQAVTDRLIADDAGVPKGQFLNVPAVQNARQIGPAKVYDAARDSLPANLSHDPQLQTDITNIGDNTSQLPRSPDVDALKQAMLAQPDMTKEQLFANIQQARDRGTKLLAGDQTDQHALGSANLQLANAYEDFAGRQLSANPNSPVSLADFQTARTQFAKNYAAEAALKGGEHIDPMAFARIAAKEPDLMTGNSQIVGQVANSLPAAPPWGAERGLVHATSGLVGAGGGALAGHLMGSPELGGIIGGAGGVGAAPYIARALHNMFSRGDPAVASATAQNPALSYFFNKDHQFQPTPSPQPPQPPPPPQGLLTHQPGPVEPTVNAGGGAATSSILDQLGLTSDVQRAGAQHPGAPMAGSEPPMNSQPPISAGEVLPQNWRGVGPDGVPNFSTTPGAGGGPPQNNRDFAAALSSLVPDNILQRAPGAPANQPFQGHMLPIEEELADALNGTGASSIKKKGGASNAPPRDKHGNSSVLDLLGL